MVADEHDIPKRPKLEKDLRTIFNGIASEIPNVEQCGSWSRLALIFRAIEIYIDSKIEKVSKNGN